MFITDKFIELFTKRTGNYADIEALIEIEKI